MDEAYGKINDISRFAAIRIGTNVAKKFIDEGYQAYVVGGCMRDAILGREPKDADIATNAPIEVMVKLFPDAKVVFPEKYQVVRLEFDFIHIEVVRMRRDVKSLGRQAEVEFTDDIEEDLKRRDFTINAIALDPSVPAIIDPFDGMGDLFSKTIRAIGDPQIRFIEDHLRILRAVRFAAQLGFEIEQKTAEAIRMLSALVADLSPQWLWRELSKGMEKPAQLKKLLLEFNLWEHLWGDIFPSPKDNTDELKAASMALPQKSLWIMFFYDDAQSLPEKMSKLAERIEFPHKLRTDILEIARIIAKIKAFDELSAPEKVKILDSLQFEDAIALARFIPELSEKAEEILRKYPKIGAKPLISGNELSSLGLKGQKLKQVLAQIRLAQLAGKIKSTVEALDMAKKLI